MKKNLHWIIVATIVMVTSGLIAHKKWPAYFSAPSELQGRYVIQRLINEQASGRLELVGFVKMGGEYLKDHSRMINNKPVTGYLMPYEFTVKFREDGQWGFFTEINGTNYWDNLFYVYVPGGAERYPKYSDDALRPAIKGATATIRGSLRFRRESGQWNGFTYGLNVLQ